MAFCAKCGAQLKDGSAFCGACGAPAGQSTSPSSGAAAAPAPVAAGMESNVAGLLCYILGIITGIIFLVIEPYKRDKFVRFHAFQSIFFWVVCFGFWMVWSFVVVGLLFSAGGLGLISTLGLLFTVIRLAMFAAWIFLMYKAYSKQEFKLPIIGDLAAKQAASV